METKDINKKNLEIATKAIQDMGIAVQNVVNALKEVVTNRGGEIVFKKKYEFVAFHDNCVLKRFFIKDDTLYIEYVENFGFVEQLTINHFEYDFLTLCNFLTYAVSE